MGTEVTDLTTNPTAFLAEQADIAFCDVRKMFRDDGTLLPLAEMDPSTAAAVASIEVTPLYAGSGEQRWQIGETKKVTLKDKGAALDILMRYHELYNGNIRGGPLLRTI